MERVYVLLRLRVVPAPFQPVSIKAMDNVHFVAALLQFLLQDLDVDRVAAQVVGREEGARHDDLQ
jgi:hypothetical protein